MLRLLLRLSNPRHPYSRSMLRLLRLSNPRHPYSRSMLRLLLRLSNPSPSVQPQHAAALLLRLLYNQAIQSTRG